MPRSYLDADSAILNTNRRFGSAASYIPVVVKIGGKEEGALFTREQVFDAIRRGKLNPEDLPKLVDDSGIIGKIGRWLGRSIF